MWRWFGGLVAAWVGAGFFGVPAWARDPVVLDSCDEADPWEVTRKPASVAAESDAAEGTGAIRVGMPGMVSRVLARRVVPGSAAWDRYDGISFRVKGDGSDQFGCLAVKGRFAFATYFSLKNTAWHKVTRRWDEFAPESQVDPIGAVGAMPPSGINTIRIGSRWTITHNNARIPEHTFAVDCIQLEASLPGPGPAPSPRPFSEILARLRDGKPVRIQCMGDSITAGTSLPDRASQRYAVLARTLLRQWLRNDTIDCFSRAVGGAKLNDARAWIPRDFRGVAPDLVTIWYGYNDKSNAYTAGYFEAALNDYIDRICRATDGAAAILLFATGPGTGPRFVMMDDYAERVRHTAERRGLPCFDIHAILKQFGRDRIEEVFADMAHPNQDGHELIADEFCQFLVTAAGIDTPKPLPPPKPDVEPGKPRKWTFEDDAGDWRLDGPATVVAGAAVSGKQSVRFEMNQPGADHTRAWSPTMPVTAHQEYTISAHLFVDSIDNDSGYGLYVCTYPDADAAGDFQVHRIASERLMKRWVPLKGKITIPEGAHAMKVLLWAHKETTGTIRFDDVGVEPVDD